MNNEKIFLMRPGIGPEELDAIREVMDSKFLTEGDQTREFEKRIAEYIGVKHAIAVTSCTTALELALQVAGIKKGAEVVVPDFTHPATALPVLSAGAEPVLVDVSDQSYNIDFGSARLGLSRRTRCVMPVSLFGRPVDQEGLAEFLHRRQLVVIEDAACSLGAEVNGKKVGTLADMTCFSFHPRKILTTGEGGMLVTDNDEYAEIARSIKSFGFGPRRGTMRGIRRGSNYKMSNILAAIGLVQISKFEKMLAERIKRARIYNELLIGNESIQLPNIPDGVKCTYQSYCVSLKRDGIRDQVKQRMLEKGIEVQIGTYALHLEPVFARAKRTRLVKSLKVFRNTLTLPLHNELRREDQERVCAELEATIRSVD